MKPFDRPSRGAGVRRARASAPRLILTLAGLIGLACSGKQEAAAPRAVPVTVAVIRPTVLPYELRANGTVEPLQSVAVRSQVTGILTRVAFAEGEEVHQGQVMFEIDPRPYMASLAQAKATLARDEAQAANAKRDAQRYQTLAQKDYVTKAQAEQMQATAEAQQATVEADRAAVEGARLNVENTRIRAPISGRTGGLLVRQGNLVNAASQTPLVLINQIRPILVRFAIPASQLGDIQRYSGGKPLAVSALPGRGSVSAGGGAGASPTGDPTGDPMPDLSADPAADRTGADASPSGGRPAGRAGSVAGMDQNPTGRAPAADPARPSGSDTPATALLVDARAPVVWGTLSFVDNAVDTTTGTVMLKAKFENGRGQLWPGQFVGVSLLLFTQQDALVLPPQAVMAGQQGTFVYVVDRTGAARLRSVTVGRTVSNGVVIDRGLAPGDRVVVDGQSRLTTGAKVAVRSTGATAEGTTR